MVFRNMLFGVFEMTVFQPFITKDLIMYDPCLRKNFDNAVTYI